MKHKIATLLFLAVITQPAFAQVGVKAQRTVGGNSTDYLNSIYLTQDGGLIAGGFSASDSSAEKTQDGRGGGDYWVVKFDSKGNIQWDKTIGGNDYDELSSLQQTNDGGYILGGSSLSDSSGEKTENNRDTFRSSVDYWLIKLDSLGHFEWDKTIGGSGNDDLSSIQQTNDGGYILGGYSSSNKSGEKTEDNRCGCNALFIYDYWVVKLDSLGNLQWNKTIGGNIDDELTSIQQTTDGGYILGGGSFSDSSSEKTENSRNGGNDYWVVKVDSLGNIQWDKTIGGNDTDELTSIQQTNDRGYILGGSSSSDSSGEKTENSRGCGACHIIDYWVVKLDSSGIFEWDKTIGGFRDDRLSCLQQTSDDGYILGGNSGSDSSGEKTERNRGRFGAFDYWVVKLDSLHNIEWDKTIGGNMGDVLANIVERKPNRYVLGGTSWSSISGNKNDTSRGSADFWIMSLVYNSDSATTNSISTYKYSFAIPHSKSNQEFKVYPNPAKDIIHIQTNGKAILSLTDQSGKILLTQTIEGSGVLNVANIPAGLYYLRNAATGATQKIIVSR